MLENMVFEGLSADAQGHLFDLFSRTNNTAGLTRLATLTNLDPNVDSRLANVSDGPVRAKWISRPGRSKEDIYTNLKREKRVAVLVELTNLDLSDDTYEVIAKANKSHTLALAVLNSDKPSEAAKAIAAGHLAVYINDGTKSAKVFAIKEAISNNPDQLPVFASGVHNWAGAQIALIGGPYEGAAAENLGKALLRELDRHDKSIKMAEVDAEKAAASPQKFYYNSNRYRVDGEGRNILDVLRNVDTSWLDLATRKAVLIRLANFQPRVEALNLDHKSLYADAIVAFKEVDDQPKRLHDLLVGVKAANNGADVLDAIKGQTAFRGNIRFQIFAAIFRNERLSYKEMENAYREMNDGGGSVHLGSFVHDFGKKLYTDFPINGLLMCMVVAPWYADMDALRRVGREDEFLAALVDAIRDGCSFHDRILQMLVYSDRLTQDMIATLPCQLLARAEANLARNSKKLLGELLARELAEVDATGLEQFERLVSKFPGTVRELAVSCKAATAV